jgi:dTDP-4-amino-4,6-dideoxygalactose transaminase
MSRPQPPEDGPFRWVHESFGSNFRMTEMQAAIGRVQLGKLDEWVATRRRNAAILAEGLADIPALYIPQAPEHVEHAFYKFYAFVVASRLGDGWSRNRLMDELNRRGVPCFGGSCSEVYRERAFVDAKLHPQMRLPVARELGDSSIMFLVHPTLSAEDMQRMLDVIRSTLDEAMSN